MGIYVNADGITFYGKHAQIIDRISATNEQLAYDSTLPPLFKRVIDSYYIAGLIGIVLNEQSQVDKTIKYKKDIHGGTLSTNQRDVNYYSGLSMVFNFDLSMSANVKEAFFCDEHWYNYARNDLFYFYALRGLEVIDEHVLKNENGEYLAPEMRLELYSSLVALLDKLEQNRNLEDTFTELPELF